MYRYLGRDRAEIVRTGQNKTGQKYTRTKGKDRTELVRLSKSRLDQDRISKPKVEQARPGQN